MSKSALSVRNMTFIAMFVALLAIGGQISIQTVIPITMQTFVVMLAGSILGARRGFVSMLVFIALVAAGAPLLSGWKSGPGALVGPTGGYIVSWPFAAFLMGLIVEKFAAKGPLKAWQITLAHITGGILLVHLIGFPWAVAALKLPLNMETFISSFLIFMPGDLIKAFVATPVALAVYRAVPWLKPRRRERENQ
ncbi:biotin transporter BioY [Paenactinomyces guangxiensis]|uniref:Biotin transporter n=1 Tax=Paenactinomyces guangxiensis TaxID=1490290 RepID=A0A7W1WMU3_9BACL|nr:biotin transporter BioY [Paenactinomyces guangxiensis]MBA4492789.1 biotin transporter BioY [Paenactinomyces guangxiensis]MBH8590362.1 biotin transporter BioY [Paenactinomyces guangxiensis]